MDGLIPLAAAALFLVYTYGLADDVWKTTQAGAVLRRRGFGGLLLGGGSVGVAAFLGLGPAALGLGAPDGWAVLAWGLLPLAVIAPALVLSGRSDKTRARYPEIRQVMDPALQARSAVAWLVYLAGYELLFRGLLLFPLVERWGRWEAIGVSTGLYALAHLRKDAGEAFACLPLGVLLSWGALDSGAIYSAVVLHVAIAWLSEALLVRARRRTPSPADG